MTITVNETKLAEVKQAQYRQCVVELIRQKYSVNDEYDVLNKGIADTADADYVAYRAYVAECKTKAKSKLELTLTCLQGTFY
jgi:hypothetical protein